MSGPGLDAAMKMQRAVAQTEKEADLGPDDDDDEGNPFKAKAWSLFLYAWAGMAVRVLIVFGGLFSIYQFLDGKEEKRVERTLQLVELWEEGEYQQAQHAIQERLDGLNVKYAQLLGPNADEAERAVYMEQVGMAAMSEDGGDLPLAEFKIAFDRVLYFLNRAAYCVEGNLCSERMVRDYFGDFAISFWSYFKSYVEQERQRGAPSYGVPVEQFIATLR